jgi:NitT/TauT family transport system ATP-binding protein
MNPVLSLKGISKYFDLRAGELLALDNINFDVLEKEFLCILGPTGSGKSVLLKVMGGVEKQTLGTITLNGESFEDGIPASKLSNFGFVFQQDNLLAWRTVVKNLRLPLEIFHRKTPEMSARVDAMLEMVGLSDYKSVYPHELSGGMRQRVSLARAMVHDPEILLMDQPLGALDAITRRMLAYELLNISRKTQKSMVMVTNSVEEALLLANRILVLSPLPGTIRSAVINDIPPEMRNEQIAEHPRYKELWEILNSMVHNQDISKTQTMEPR